MFRAANFHRLKLLGVLGLLIYVLVDLHAQQKTAGAILPRGYQNSGTDFNNTATTEVSSAVVFRDVAANFEAASSHMGRLDEKDGEGETLTAGADIKRTSANLRNLGCQGGQLLDLIAADAATASKKLGMSGPGDSQSNWTTDDPPKLGWSYVETREYAWEEPSQLQMLQKAVPLSMDRTDNFFYRMAQNVAFVDGGSKFQPTYAEYSMVFNIGQGALYVLDMISPQAAASHLKMKNYTRLGRFSDLAYIVYAKLIAESTSKAKFTDLKYLVHVQVTNEATLEVMKSVTGIAHENGFKAWPGDAFAMEEPEGKALLASPNGRSAAWIMINHKESFGNRTVSKAVVFSDDSRTGNPCLAFIFGNPNETNQKGDGQ